VGFFKSNTQKRGFDFSPFSLFEIPAYLTG
jgi:hypothetical protein